MSAVRAISSTKNITQDQRVFEVGSKVYELEPSSNPLCRLLNLPGMGSRSVENPKFYHWSDTVIGRQTAINNGAGYNDSAPSIVVDDGSIFSENSLMKNLDTGEICLVTAVSTNTLTVTRGFGETAAAAMTDNDNVVRLGSAHAEGAASKTPNVLTVSDDYNFTQIFRTAFGVSRTLQQSKLYTGPELARLRRKKAIEHSLDQEHQFLFGERYESADTANPQRQTRGLETFISTNVSAITTITEPTFDDWIATCSRYGSSEKILLANATLITALDYWGKQRLRGDEGMTKKLGLKVMSYETSHMSLKVIKHKLLEGNTYSGYAFLIDPANISMATLQGTKLRTNIQSPDVDGTKEEYLTECGLDVQLEQTHGMLTGITGYA